MRLWAFSLKITRRDEMLADVEEELRKVGVTRTGIDGVKELAVCFRNADAFARGAARRVTELEASIKEYEAALRRIQVVEHRALTGEQIEATPIERAARRSSGIDLPHTQRTPVYHSGGRALSEDGRARPTPVLRTADPDTLGTIDLTELKTDEQT
jgi:hypothetical protein